MTFTDTTITILVLVAVFVLLYSGYRKQGIGETIQEIKGAFSDKVEDAKNQGGQYINT